MCSWKGCYFGMWSGLGRGGMGRRLGGLVFGLHPQRLPAGDLRLFANNDAISDPGFGQKYLPPFWFLSGGYLTRYTGLTRLRVC